MADEKKCPCGCKCEGKCDCKCCQSGKCTCEKKVEDCKDCKCK